MAPSFPGESIRRPHVPGAWPEWEDEHDEQHQVQKAQAKPYHVPGAWSELEDEDDVADDSREYYSAEEGEPQHAQEQPTASDEFLNHVPMEDVIFSDDDYQLSEQEASIILADSRDASAADETPGLRSSPATQASTSTNLEPTEEETARFARLFHVAQQRGLIPSPVSPPREEEIQKFVHQFNVAQRRGLIPSHTTCPDSEPPVPQGPLELEGSNSWDN